MILLLGLILQGSYWNVKKSEVFCFVLSYTMHKVDTGPTLYPTDGSQVQISQCKACNIFIKNTTILKISAILFCICSKIILVFKMIKMHDRQDKCWKCGECSEIIWNGSKNNSFTSNRYINENILPSFTVNFIYDWDRDKRFLSYSTLPTEREKNSQWKYSSVKIGNVSFTSNTD